MSLRGRLDDVEGQVRGALGAVLDEVAAARGDLEAVFSEVPGDHLETLNGEVKAAVQQLKPQIEDLIAAIEAEL